MPQVFVAISYLPNLAPRRAIDLFALTVFWTYWCFTAIILCDQARRCLGNRSLLDVITASPSALLRFLATGTASGVLLDGSGQWLGKLWIYPYWNTALYAATFVLGFSAYWLLLAESYFLARAIVRRGLRVRPPAGNRSGGPLAPSLTGVSLTLAGLLLAVHDYRAAGGYRFAVSHRTGIHIHFSCFLLLFVGVWLLLEGLERRRSRASLLTAIGRKDWAPAIAVLAAGWAFGFFMETTNAGQHFWVYTNWPLEQFTIAGVPAMVLLAWPLQYVVFLSVSAAIGGDLANDVW